jgi:thiol-disulfide isomerase/thioredoxin
MLMNIILRGHVMPYFSTLRQARSVITLVLSFSLLWVTGSHAADKGNAVMAADFTLASKAHGNLRLQEQIGSVVLINFWASWCGPCRQELPLLEEIQQQYADLGFTIFAVNVDKDSSKADVLLNDIPVSFPVLFDPDSKVSELYQVKAMPTTVIVDRDGKVRFVHLGYKNGDTDKYQQIIKTLLRE